MILCDKNYTMGNRVAKQMQSLIRNEAMVKTYDRVASSVGHYTWDLATKNMQDRLARCANIWLRILRETRHGEFG